MNVSSVSRVLCIIAAVIALHGPRQHAEGNAELERQFASAYEVDGTMLELRGAGVLTYLGFFRIYNGALYLPATVGAEQALEDVAKRLEVKYLRPFKAEDFGPATIAGIRKNVDPKLYAQLNSRIADHNKMYRDINRGDRVALTYLPSTGTMVEINGETIGTIRGADFARALFSMWLGENPFDPKFKKALVGGSQ